MDIRYRLEQLKIVHWVTIALAVVNVALLSLGLSAKNTATSVSEVIYPPNLMSIILIDSPEYLQFLASLAHPVDEVMMCYELGPFIEKENIDAIQHQLTKHEFGVQRKTDTEKEVTGYWVYLDPERSRALGRLKVEEIKLKGLKDVVLLTQNNPRYAISLGFFKAKEFAHKRLLRAQSLGLNAKMDIRYKNQDYQWLLVEVAENNDMSQQEWLKILHDYKNIELKTVNCQ